MLLTLPNTIARSGSGRPQVADGRERRKREGNFMSFSLYTVLTLSLHHARTRTHTHNTHVHTHTYTHARTHTHTHTHTRTHTHTHTQTCDPIGYKRGINILHLQLPLYYRVAHIGCHGNNILLAILWSQNQDIIRATWNGTETE